MRRLLNKARSYLAPADRPSRKGRTVRRCPVLLCFDILEDRTVPTSITWGGGNGNWNVGTNWVGNVAPVAGDLVTINAGTVHVTDAEAAANINIATAGAALSVDNGGTLTNTAGLSVTGSLTTAAGGALNIQGGPTIGGTGTFTNAGTLTVAAGATAYLSGTLTNASGGTLAVQNGGTFYVYYSGSQLTNQSGGIVSLVGGTLNASYTFLNQGTLSTSGGTLTGSGFQNDGGGISVTAGTLNLGGSGSSTTNGGSITVASGAVLSLTATCNWEGTWTGTGAGVVDLTGIIQTVGGTAPLSLNFASNLLHANSVSASLYGGSGGLTNTGDFTIDSGVTVYISGAVNNSGTFTVKSGATLYVYFSGAVFTNQSGGTLTLAGGSINASYSFVNQGTLSISTTSSLTSTGFSNSGGTISVASGQTFTLTGGTFTGGTLTIAGTLTLQGTSTWTGTWTGSGSGAISSQGTIVAGSGGVNFDFTGSLFQWDGGTWEGLSGNTITNSGTVTVVSGIIDYVDGALTNANGGTIVVQSGATLYVYYSGSQLTNQSGGTITLAGGTLNAAYSTINQGTLSTSGNATVTGGAFQNDGGSLSVTAGTFALQSTNTSTSNGGSINVASGAVLAMSGTYTWAGTWTGTGAGTVDLTGTIQTVGGTAALSLNFATGMLHANSSTAYLFGGTGGLTNAGDFTIDSGVTVYVGGAVNNSGTFTVNTGVSGAGLLYVYYSGTVLTNQSGGTLTLAGGSLNAAYSFVNQGTLSISTTASLTGTGFANSGGTISVASGQTFTLTGGTFTGGTLTIAGTLTLQGTSTWTGTWTGSGSGAISSQGTIVAGTGGVNFDFTGSLFQWDGGTWDGLSGNTITNSGTITVVSGVIDYLDGALTNASGGTILVQSSGNLDVYYSVSVLTNQSGGTISLVGGATAGTAAILNAAYTFTNQGTLSTSGFANVSGTAYQNDGGAISVTGGTFSLPGSVGSTTNGGSISVASGAVVAMSGIYTWEGTWTGTGAGIVDLTGTIQTAGSNALSLNFATGMLHASSGSAYLLGNSGALTNAGDFTIDTGVTVYLGGVVNNSGTLTVSTGASGAGTLYVYYSGTTLTNTGTITLAGGTLNASYTFTNSGTLSVTNASALTGTGFANSGGTISVASGQTFTLTGGTFTGGTLTIAGTLTLQGTSTWTGTWTGSGSGAISSQGTIVAGTGGVNFDFTGSLFQWDGGTWDGLSGNTITNSGTITVVSGVIDYLDGALTNASGGTIVVQSSATLYVYYSVSVLTNQSGGTISLVGGATAGTAAILNAAYTFTNQGTLSTSGFANVSGTAYQNDGGAISVTGGTFSLPGSVGSTTNGGSITVASGAVLALPGTYTWAGTWTGTGAGIVDLTGTIQTAGSNALSLNFATGMLHANSGSAYLLGNSGALTNAGDFTIDSGVTVYLGGVVNNSGTWTVSTGASGAGTLYVYYSGTQLTNQSGGTITLAGGTLNASYSFTNSGTLSITGTTTLAGTAFSNNGGTISVASGQTWNVSSGTFAGGTLTLAGTLNLTGTTTWSGTFTSSGGGAVDLNGTINGSGANFDFSAGTFQWQSGTIDGGAAGFTNSGFMTLTGAAAISNGFTDSGTLTDTGAGALTLGFLSNLNVSGTLDLQGTGGITGGSGFLTVSGMLQQSAGSSTVNPLGVSLDGGIVFVAAGATLTLGDASDSVTDTANGGTLNATGTLNLPGNYNWQGTIGGSGNGTINFSGSLDDINFLTLDFTGSVFQWTGGSMDGTNGTTNAGTITDSAGAGGVTMIESISNTGTFIDASTGTITLASGGTFFTNLASGLVDFQTDAGVTSSAASIPLNQFINSGTVQKSGGTGTTVLQAFNNTGGTINVLTGTIALAGGSNTDGFFTVAAGATLDLTGGQTTSFAGNFIGFGAGTISLNSGTLNLSADATFGFTNTNGLNISGGTLDPAMIVSTLTNTGLIDVTAATLVPVINLAIVNNDGTIQITGAGLDLTAANAPLTNDGLITANSALAQLSGGTVDNNGTITVTGGTFDLTGIVTQVVGGTLTGGTWNVLNGSTLAFPGTPGLTDNAASVTLDGPGSTFTQLGTITTNDGSLSLLDGATLSLPSDLTNTGTLTIGTSTTAGSTLTVAGNFTQTSTGTLAVEVGGTQPSGLYGQANVAGTATLDGTVQATAVNGFNPSSGFNYPVLTYASETGSFATVQTAPFTNATMATAFVLNPGAPPLPPPPPPPAPTTTSGGSSPTAAPPPTSGTPPTNPGLPSFIFTPTLTPTSAPPPPPSDTSSTTPAGLVLISAITPASEIILADTPIGGPIGQGPFLEGALPFSTLRAFLRTTADGEGSGEVAQPLFLMRVGPVDGTGNPISAMRVTNSVARDLHLQNWQALFSGDDLAARIAATSSTFANQRAVDPTSNDASNPDAAHLPPVVRFSIVTAGVNPLNSGNSLNDGSMSVLQVEKLLTGRKRDTATDTDTDPPPPPPVKPPAPPEEQGAAPAPQTERTSDARTNRKAGLVAALVVALGNLFVFPARARRARSSDREGQPSSNSSTTRRLSR